MIYIGFSQILHGSKTKHFFSHWIRKYFHSYSIDYYDQKKVYYDQTEYIVNELS